MRPMRARNLQDDLEEASHNIFTTPQANLGAAFADLELGANSGGYEHVSASPTPRSRSGPTAGQHAP